MIHSKPIHIVQRVLREALSTDPQPRPQEEKLNSCIPACKEIPDFLYISGTGWYRIGQTLHEIVPYHIPPCSFHV